MINSISNHSSLSRAVGNQSVSRGSVSADQLRPVAHVSRVESVNTDYSSKPRNNNFAKVIKLDANSTQTPLNDRRRNFVSNAPGFKRPEQHYQVNQQLTQRQELDQMIGLDIRV
jgi:hypothetical protein